ncbi:Hypothetical protein CINCED_3A002627, partial [Cinara cedri]
LSNYSLRKSVPAYILVHQSIFPIFFSTSFAIPYDQRFLSPPPLVSSPVGLHSMVCNVVFVFLRALHVQAVAILKPSKYTRDKRPADNNLRIICNRSRVRRVAIRYLFQISIVEILIFRLKIHKIPKVITTGYKFQIILNSAMLLSLTRWAYNIKWSVFKSIEKFFPLKNNKKINRKLINHRLVSIDFYTVAKFLIENAFFSIDLGISPR